MSEQQADCPEVSPLLPCGTPPAMPGDLAIAPQRKQRGKKPVTPGKGTWLRLRRRTLILRVLGLHPAMLNSWVLQQLGQATEGQAASAPTILLLFFCRLRKRNLHHDKRDCRQLILNHKHDG